MEAENSLKICLNLIKNNPRIKVDACERLLDYILDESKERNGYA